MAGYGMKRPYPGEWQAYPPPPPMGHKHPRMQHEPAYWHPGHEGAFPGYDGGYGGGGPGWGSKAPGAGRGKKDSDGAQDANMDFTDDYQAFYGQASGGRGRGSFRGRGRGQGQMRGGTGKPSNQGGNQNGAQQQQQGAGNRGGGGGGRGRGQQRGGRGQRGLPPNQWGRGRGRGQRGNKTASVPPVHTLAKAKPLYPDLLNMSVAEKLHRFCLFLRADDGAIKINAIQTIMNAITSTKLGMKVEYEAEELTKVQGKSMYTGVLTLDDTFIARGVGANKKELKQEVFLKAYNIMIAKTVAEIYHLHDPGTDSIRKELEDQMKSEDEAKKKIKQLDGQALETIGKDMPAVFDAFVDAVKNMKDRPESCISYIEQAAPQARLLLRPKYEFEVVTLPTGRQYFVGKLTYGDVVFGRAGALTKKLCRAETYTKALNRMLELSIDELRVSMPEEELPEMEEANLPPQTKIKMRNLPLEERLAELIRHVVTMPYKEGSVNPIDVAAAAHGLTPMIVYRTSKMQADTRLLLECDLYLDRILMASSEGTRRKVCMSQVYNQTWEVLTTTSVETLLTQHKRITDEELRDPLIVDVITKGSGKTSESNTAGLKRYGHDLTKIEDNRIEDLVIVEHGDWSKNRTKNAFCILQFSCTSNGLMLHWETEAVTNQYKNINCKCTMFVQKQQVGESYADNRMHAKHLAATDALFKLYQLRPVIQIISRDDETDWIAFDAIKTEADKLRAQNPDVDAGLKTTDEAGNPLPDPFIMKVITEKLNAFAVKKEDEFIIGPGMALAESRATRVMAKAMDLKCDHRQYQGEHYFAFYEKMAYTKLVEHMKKLGSPYRKYAMVSLEDLPRYEEVKGNVIHNPVPKDPKN